MWRREEGNVGKDLVVINFFMLNAVYNMYRLLPFSVTRAGVDCCTLYTLVFDMKLDINGSPRALGGFHSLGPQLVFLPVVAVLKALTNSTTIDLVLARHSVASYLTMNSKFNCCSLSDVFVARCGKTRLNAVTLLTGVDQRVLALLTTPLLMQ